MDVLSARVCLSCMSLWLCVEPNDCMMIILSHRFLWCSCRSVDGRICSDVSPVIRVGWDNQLRIGFVKGNECMGLLMIGPHDYYGLQ